MDFLSKRSTINQNLEQLILDIPTYILIMENLSDRLEEKLGWKEFKFCFKLATSQIVSFGLIVVSSSAPEPLKIFGGNAI